MQVTINVNLERTEDCASLVFNFDKVLKLSLTSDDQNLVKSFFQELLAKMFDDYQSAQTEYCLKFSDDDGKDLFHDVGSKYVSLLSNEMQAIYSKIK